jgi:tRNA threonylcarbamoyladenosine biosynthesis protein TsaB
MRTLAIETAGRACSIAVLENGAIVAERHEQVGRGHAERLIPWIAALPDGGRADRIIVGCGPGSFTGVRIGIAAARGLALGWSVPVFGVSSLLLVAADCDADTLVVAVEGGHGELLVQEFERDRLVTTTRFMSALPDIAAVAMRAETVVGDGAKRLIAARGYGTAVDADARASNVRYLQQRLAMLAPSPIYSRAPDAQPSVATSQ